jgi:hypothetical protein
MQKAAQCLHLLTASHSPQNTVANIRFLHVWEKTLKKCFENYMFNTQTSTDQYIADEVSK